MVPSKSDEKKPSDEPVMPPGPNPELQDDKTKQVEMVSWLLRLASRDPTVRYEEAAGTAANWAVPLECHC